MSPVAPFGRGTEYFANFSGRPSATWGDLVTASGTPHSLSGTEVELASAAEVAFDVYRMTIIVHSSSTTATSTDQLLNIYTGGSGSEVVLIDSLLAGWSAAPLTAFPMRVYDFPIYIQAGTRISADLRSQIASDDVRVMIELHGGGFLQGGWVGQGVETKGHVIASSRGTLITPGGASEGTFTDIASSSTTAFEWRYIVPMTARNTDTTMLARYFALDVGVGGSALTGLSNFLFQQNTNENSGQIHSTMGRYCRIAAGTQLQARMQDIGTNVEATDCCLYGVY